MSDIHIVYSETGKPEVLPDLQVVRQGDYIQWYIHSENSAVREVEVRFNGTLFFGERKAGYKAQAFKRVPLEKGIGHLTGRAPDFTGDLNSKIDKYTIRAFKEGKEGAELTDLVKDPRIITDKP